MIRSVTTLVYGIAVAVLVILTALAAAIWIVGMSAKASLFGEPRSTLAIKVFERLMKARQDLTDITDITPNNGEGP